MNKNQLITWFKQAGFTTSYSGKQRKMYVHGIGQNQLDYFGLSTRGITLIAD